MKSQVVSVTGVGNSSPVVVDTRVSPVALGLGAQATGTVTYSVQYCFDDPGAGFVNWFTSTTLTGQTASAFDSCLFPVTGVRVAITAGTGTVALTVAQAGI